jgi:diguanylate cyclase (GGDEF)-like protein
MTGVKNYNWLCANKQKVKCQYVYFIDINNLKEINKRGHNVGNVYIRSIVQKLRLLTDVELVRYGGDEFVVLSNKNDLFKTNEFITVGSACVKGRLTQAIKEANGKMICAKGK